MVTVFSSDLLPLESVTVAVNTIFPELVKPPVVNEESLLENPPPLIE